MDPGLLPNAKSAENQIKNVIICGGAGDFVEWPKGTVKIEKKHFVRDTIVNGGLSTVEGTN